MKREPRLHPRSQHDAIREVIEYAERPGEHGFVIMDTPGRDIEQGLECVAGGAPVVIFATGQEPDRMRHRAVHQSLDQQLYLSAHERQHRF